MRVTQLRIKMWNKNKFAYEMEMVTVRVCASAVLLLSILFTAWRVYR